MISFVVAFSNDFHELMHLFILEFLAFFGFLYLTFSNCTNKYVYLHLFQRITTD